MAKRLAHMLFDGAYRDLQLTRDLRVALLLEPVEHEYNPSPFGQLIESCLHQPKSFLREVDALWRKVLVGVLVLVEQLMIAAAPAKFSALVR